MKIHVIQMKYNEIESSIKNTAKHYPEGRDILIYCLSKAAKRTQQEVIDFLRTNYVPIYKIDEYKFRDDID